MNKSSRIFIAGASGMVGSAIARNLIHKGYTNLVGNFHSRQPEENSDLPVDMFRLDLRNQADVARFFKNHLPDYVFLAAARVGGIHANNTWPAQFIHDNLVMQTNIIHAAYENDVKRLLFLGSSCIYPKHSLQPMKEEHLLTGVLEPTNEPYAIAKIAGIKMCEAYNRQYGTQFIAVMPTNLYGPNDNFDLESSHVLPALIRKFHEAKVNDSKRVMIWGTGSPRREFLHVDDMADGSVFVMTLSDSDVKKHLTAYPSPCFLNLGTGIDLTIMDLAHLVRDTVGFEGTLEFDTSKPDGTMKKLLDVSRLEHLGWKARISLGNGIESTYRWFLRHLSES